MVKLLVGADPELFIRQGSKFINAHGIIPGTKTTPEKVPHGAVQVDGFAAEFNIDPARTKIEFVENLLMVRQTLQSYLPDGAQLVASPVAKFDPEYYEAQPEESKELGCDPDFSAWRQGAANPKPNNKPNIRVAGGHVHVGWRDNDVDPNDPVHIQDCIAIVKQLDCYLGVPSLLWDRNHERRSMYGKAGAFRPKSYGVEYRTLSNKWLESEELMGYVYDNTIKAINDLLEGKPPAANCGLDIRDLIDASRKYALGDIRHYLDRYMPYVPKPPVKEAA